jgi:hypothetical protein
VDRAAVLEIEPGDRPQKRGLAAAGWAEEADELALADIEIDTAQRLETAEALREIANREKGSRMYAGSWPAL